MDARDPVGYGSAMAWTPADRSAMAVPGFPSQAGKQSYNAAISRQDRGAILGGDSGIGDGDFRWTACGGPSLLWTKGRPYRDHLSPPRQPSTLPGTSRDDPSCASPNGKFSSHAARLTRSPLPARGLARGSARAARAGSTATAALPGKLSLAGRTPFQTPASSTEDSPFSRAPLAR